MNCAVEGGHVAAEQKQAMIGVHDADVFTAVVLVPVRHPLVPRKTPPFPACVAQVDTCQLDWSVQLRQVCHVCVSFVNLLRHVKTVPYFCLHWLHIKERSLPGQSTPRVFPRNIFKNCLYNRRPPKPYEPLNVDALLTILDNFRETTGSLLKTATSYLNVSVDEVFAAATVLPLSAGNLVNLRRLPDWIDALRVVPQKHEPVAFERDVRLHFCRFRN